MRQISFSKERAFTLVELLIVIAIIAILTVAFLPGALKAPARARDAGRAKALQDIAATIEAYSSEKAGTLPASASPYCLVDVAVLSSYFSNGYPVDPKPTTNGACGTALKNTSYFYRVIGSNYILGGIMEVQASGNSSVQYGAGTDLSAAGTTYANIQAATLKAQGGTADAITPNATTPYFLVLGPR